MTQKVELSVPADPQFARCVRMCAASLGVACGMSVDEIEDIRMAAEESFIMACATGVTTCDIAFEICKSHMAMVIAMDEAAEAKDDPSVQYAGLLLEAVCDEYEIVEEDGHVHMHIAKYVGGVHGA